MSVESENKSIQATQMPNTISTLRRDFEALGLRPGSTIIMHSAMSKIGWTAGGPVAVIEALLSVLTPEGTLVMPAHTSSNSEPSQWRYPPVPESWWQIIRDETPAFDPKITPTRMMGAIAETFRTWPGVLRSSHPQGSFAAWGKHAAYVTATQPLDADLGEDSPIGKIYELDGQVLLLGVTHANNTSLHLAEHRSDFPGKKLVPQGAAMLVDGKRVWATWQALDYDSDDFEKLGEDYEASVGYQPGKVGQAVTRLISQRAVVDFAVKWLPEHRPQQ